MKMGNIDRHWRDESRKLGSSSSLHICDFPQLHWVLSWLFSPGIVQKLTEYRLEFIFQFILEEAISTFQTFILIFEPVNLTLQMHWHLATGEENWPLRKFDAYAEEQIYVPKLVMHSPYLQVTFQILNTWNKALTTKVTSGIFSVLTIG